MNQTVGARHQRGFVVNRAVTVNITCVCEGGEGGVLLVTEAWGPPWSKCWAGSGIDDVFVGNIGMLKFSSVVNTFFSGLFKGFFSLSFGPFLLLNLSFRSTLLF
jgi:hypothetical protein